jgi:hypothetical protein
VQYILDSVVSSLQQNPDRRFIYGELSFFSRWWAEQGEGVRDVVRKLITDGQLSFVNGGCEQPPTYLNPPFPFPPSFPRACKKAGRVA